MSWEQLVEASSHLVECQHFFHHDFYDMMQQTELYYQSSTLVERGLVNDATPAFEDMKKQRERFFRSHERLMAAHARMEILKHDLARDTMPVPHACLNPPPLVRQTACVGRDAESFFTTPTWASPLIGARRALFPYSQGETPSEETVPPTQSAGDESSLDGFEKA